VDDESGRERLMTAAWQVLERTGFAGFKVASVLRAAGASTTTFYRHFDSKDALFVELLRDEARRGAARIERLVAEAGDPPQAVRAWIAANMSAAASPTLRPRARLFAGLSEHVEGHPQAFAEVRDLLMRSLVSAIEAGVLAGQLTSADVHDDALRIQGLARAAIADLLAGVEADPETVVSSVQGFALRALSAGTR
jgi:AcrR family transcriptional regulator